VVKIVAVGAQSIFLVVCGMAWNSLIRMDGLDVGAYAVFLCQHRRGCTLRRVGRVTVGGRVVCGHLDRRKAERSKGCLQRQRTRRAIVQAGGWRQWSQAPGQQEETKEQFLGKMNCMYTNWPA
jgi:hypothetical protein